MVYRINAHTIIFLRIYYDMFYTYFHFIFYIEIFEKNKKLLIKVLYASTYIARNKFKEVF